MSKTKRIILFLIITIFVLGFNLCYAVDLNMTNDDDLLDDIDSASNTYNENSSNSRLRNSNTTTNSIDDEDEDIYDNDAVNTSLSDTSNIPSTTVTNVNSSGLELTNILNILLIVIGVLLILLSIAILIRLKK